MAVVVCLLLLERRRRLADGHSLGGGSGEGLVYKLRERRGFARGIFEGRSGFELLLRCCLSLLHK